MRVKQETRIVNLSGRCCRACGQRFETKEEIEEEESFFRHLGASLAPRPKRLPRARL